VPGARRTRARTRHSVIQSVGGSTPGNQSATLAGTGVGAAFVRRGSPPNRCVGRRSQGLVPEGFRPYEQKFRAHEAPHEPARAAVARPAGGAIRTRVLTVEDVTIHNRIMQHRSEAAAYGTDGEPELLDQRPHEATGEVDGPGKVLVAFVDRG
jgi:hypothetical protein